MEYRSPLPRILLHPFRTRTLLRLILKWLKLYFTAQEEAKSRQAVVIETSVDDRIEPDDRAIYPYLFAVVYILFVAWSVFDRLEKPQYKRCKRAFLGMMEQAQQTFLEVPTTMRDRRRLKHPLVRYTQSIDGPTNCFPSLHVALVVLSYQIIKDSEPTDELMLDAMRKSCIEICRSTLETKQHSVIDVVGGIEIARQSYEANSEGSFEPLLAEIIPELTLGELNVIAEAVDGATDLIGLLRKLLERFGDPVSLG